jgi:long-subunit fatty acid transport protein
MRHVLREETMGRNLTRRAGQAAALLLTTTAMAQAGGVERNPQTTAMLFEEGTYLEFGYTYTDPDVSGVQVVTAGATSLEGSRSGEVIPDFSHYSVAFRSDVTEAVSFAIIVDEPIGAIVDYTPLGLEPGYLYRAGEGSQAELSSQQLTIAGRYETPDGFSVYAGLRFVSFEGTVSLFNGSGGLRNPAGRYLLDAEASTEVGYMLGAAYEVPDIALRVALTYYSETTHDVSATETTDTFGTRDTDFETKIPQQVLLEAQTGVREGTLVFGSIRWTDWTEFEISPQDYIDTVSAGRALVDYEEDVWTWSIGGAQVLNDQWTLLGSITYEAEQDVFSGNLGPTDGRTSIGLGARFTEGPIRITGGVNYTWIGEAETQAPQPFPDGTQFSSFQDNEALSLGLRVGFNF